MKTIQINTTQNVHINFELANVGQRLLAFIIDNVIKFGYLMLIVYAFDFKLVNDTYSGDYWSIKAIDVLLFLPITFYSLYTEILLNGQTIGKKIMSIRVMNIDGFKPTTIDYLIRWFLRIVDFNFFMLVFVFMSSVNSINYIGFIYLSLLVGKMIGFFSIIITKNNQRVGDMSANTIVVSLKDTTKFSHTIIENLADDYKPKYASVIKLSDNDVRIIKESFKVARSAKNYATLIKLRTKIEEVTGVKSQEKSDIEFIDRVLKDYNYYTRDV